jgi:MOSC domain-containing protein YiiM
MRSQIPCPLRQHHGQERGENLIMEVISINVGLPRNVEWQGQTIQTSIFKEPVSGRVQVRRLNVEGDRQSDLTVHGGADKAVYVYAKEHYPFWAAELPGVDLPWGAFGENFTTTGLSESNVSIGDRLRIGSAEFVVTQPRMPCFKLAIRFNRADMVKRFLHSGRTGFYLAVSREGEAGAGDAISVIEKHPDAITVADVVSLYAADQNNQDLLRRVSRLTALPDGWRDYFRKRLRQNDQQV